MKINKGPWAPEEVAKRMEQSEAYRANAIADVCCRDGRSQSETIATMVSMGVADNLIARIIGEAPSMEFKPKVSKERVLSNWISSNSGREITAPALAKEIEVSVSTATARIKDAPMCFKWIRRGVYLVNDAVAERQAALQEAKTSKLKV